MRQAPGGGRPEPVGNRRRRAQTARRSTQASQLVGTRSEPHQRRDHDASFKQSPARCHACYRGDRDHRVGLQRLGRHHRSECATSAAAERGRHSAASAAPASAAAAAASASATPLAITPAPIAPGPRAQRRQGRPLVHRARQRRKAGTGRRRAEVRNGLQCQRRRRSTCPSRSTTTAWPPTSSRSRSLPATRPDIIGPVGVEGLNIFRDNLLDLAPLIKSQNFDLTKFDPALADFFNMGKNGATIGVPYATYPSFLYYNKKLFDEAKLPYPPTKVGRCTTASPGTWRPSASSA